MALARGYARRHGMRHLTAFAREGALRPHGEECHCARAVASDLARLCVVALLNATSEKTSKCGLAAMAHVPQLRL